MLQAISDLLKQEWLADLVIKYDFFWPICEFLHFVGLTLLVGITGLFDLRLLGLAKQAPAAPLHRLIPWAIGGFATCLVTGVVFICGDSFKEPIVTLTNLSFQLKMLLMFIAGINVGVFYLTGMSKEVEALGPGDDAPRGAKIVAATSLISWIGVIYFGRMLPWQDALLYALGL